jgi:hypothetical protein
VTSPKWRTGQGQPQPIINVPAPTVIVQQPPASASAPTKTGWARTWSVAKVTGPAIASVTALVISLLAYNDQHNADRLAAQAAGAARSAALAHVAQQVSYTQEPGGITIVNASTSKIFDVLLDYDEGEKTILDTVPACTTVSLYLAAVLPHFSKLRLSDIEFIDPDGRVWQLDPYGLYKGSFKEILDGEFLDGPQVTYYPTKYHCS